ncbi:MAG: STAS domain-containing protein [Mycobacteriaceae bacterium]|nr:STAS domain-containing protein [Mycobacteriaceae bacterium]MBV9638435.1 STAS domain-containing protein [Mycobacteriaceae bacterium]
MVEVSGEIDASNADLVTDYIHRSVPTGPALIVDITDVGFLGVQGVRALMGVGEECGRAGVAWALVASQSVIRLLRLMRRGELLPAVASLTEALQYIALTVDADRR